MRVVSATRFGGPEVLEPGEAPDPESGAGEMAVDVALAEVLPAPRESMLARSGRA